VIGEGKDENVRFLDQKIDLGEPDEGLLGHSLHILFALHHHKAPRLFVAGRGGHPGRLEDLLQFLPLDLASADAVLQGFSLADGFHGLHNALLQ
jgi:hypothetical protein